MKDLWVVRVKGQGYASKEFYTNGGSGRPLVKSRNKALELKEDELQSDKRIHSVLRDLWSRGIKLKDISVRSADPHRENFLQIVGYWNLFSSFRANK